MNISKLDDLELLINSLTDTFTKYLLPGAIQNRIPILDGRLKAILEDEHQSRKSKIEGLLEWILDDKNAVWIFANVLWDLAQTSDGSLYITSGIETNVVIDVNEGIYRLLQMVNGSSDEISKEHWGAIIDEIYDNKIIPQVDCERCKNELKGSEICLQMIRSIRRQKPDWPLVFLRALKKRCPNIFTPNIIISTKLPEETPKIDAISEIQWQDDNNRNSLASDTFMFSPFSEISDSSFLPINENERPSSTYVKINLQEDKNAETWSQLKDMGLIDNKYFTTETQVKQSITTQTSGETFFSDESDSEKEEEKESPKLSLRKYQEELAVNALKGRNTIICAPTGSGKTRVATHIILEHLQQQKDNEPKRKVAFFARTVPLVMQQFKSLKKYLPQPFQVTNLTGDSEDSMHLHMMLPDNDVIVMTPRILENHFKRKCLPHLGVFSMLVFDECHHTRKGEPYNKLMYNYLKTKTTNPDVKLPQIVGLTASISVEKAVQDEEAIQCILKVCGNLDAESISIVKKYEEELKATVPVPEEKMIELVERENDRAVTQIIKVMAKLEDKIAFYGQETNRPEMKSSISKMPMDRKSQQYGQWAVTIKNIAKSIPRNEVKETNLSVRYIIIIADYLAAYNVALETHDLVQLGDVLHYLEGCFIKYRLNEKRTTGEETFYNLFVGIKEMLEKRKDNQNPNLQKLQDTLKTYLIDKGEKSCGIIFVRTRALTDALTSWLNRCEDEGLRKLKATVFTGTAASVDQGGLTQTEQEEIIQRFKTGEVRLLVATSVGEEGLDIPECNLVIKYNHVGNEVTTVQTRGRSRKIGGMSVLLGMKRIITKEKINQEKAKMMMRAIKAISDMRRSSIRKENKVHQHQILQDEDILEMVRQQEECSLKNKSFHMVCHLCRKLVIPSDKIKTIFDTHRVVVDRTILNSTKVIPYRNAKQFDEVQLIGSVRCMSEPEPGKHCNSKIGSMMIFSGVPFLVLTIKSFGFDTNSQLGLEFYNQWKKVPYLINRLEPSDITSYFPKRIVEINPTDEEDEDSDSDDDDSDDSKGNKPPHLKKHTTQSGGSVSLAANAQSLTEVKKESLDTDIAINKTNSKTLLKNSTETENLNDSGRYSYGDGQTDLPVKSDAHQKLESFDTTEPKYVPNVRRNILEGVSDNAFQAQMPGIESSKQNNYSSNNIDKALNEYSPFSTISERPLIISSGCGIGSPLISGKSSSSYSVNSNVVSSSYTHSSGRSDNRNVGNFEAQTRINNNIPSQLNSGEKSVHSSNEENLHLNAKSSNMENIPELLNHRSDQRCLENIAEESIQRNLVSSSENGSNSRLAQIGLESRSPTGENDMKPVQRYLESSNEERLNDRLVKKSLENRSDQRVDVKPVQRSLEPNEEERFNVRPVQRSLEPNDEERFNVRPVQRSLETNDEERFNVRPVQRHLEPNDEERFNVRPVQRSLETNDEERFNVRPVQRSLETNDEETFNARPVQRSLENSHDHSQIFEQSGGEVQNSSQAEREETEPKRQLNGPDREDRQDPEDSCPPSRGLGFLSDLL
ncbi:ATP-dependent RNA helicase DDX58 [Biomphalaria glabrata]|nr:putative ATP-dependent RNA helicase DDX58 [Biomphalaria glabrata]